jgi:hypothetical protein
MISLPSGVRVWLACGHTDMRKGMDGLAMLAQQVLEESPFSGALFAFRGRRGQQATFSIQFPNRQDRVSLASAVWANIAGIVTSTRERLAVHLHGRAAIP